MNVLIVGLSGLGVEVAKNLILAGYKVSCFPFFFCMSLFFSLLGARSVTIHDNEPASWMDLSSQFYLTEEDVRNKIPRAKASFSKLSGLNPYVKVVVHEGPVAQDDVLAQFQVVIACNVLGSVAEVLGEHLHRLNKGFIWAQSRAVFGQIFVDFGAEFHVRDPDGRQREEYVIMGISNTNPVEVRVLAEEERPLARFIDDGAEIELFEVQGMKEINGQKGVARLRGKDALVIEGIDASKYSRYSTGGVLRETRKGMQMSFQSIKASRLAPGEFQMEDWGKWGRAQQLHDLFQVLDEFGQLPDPSNAEQFCQLVARKFPEVDGELAKTFALLVKGSISPMSAFLGGVVAQEALKYCGKFTPIRQWAYFDATDVLPNPLPRDRSLKGDCFDGQRYVFGEEMQLNLSSMKAFMVGSGALGCELLKGLACMGAAQAPDHGKLTVTDMDHIEKSNLSRQFLFRDGDIGKPKSVVACKAALEMSPNLALDPLTVPVGVDTENLFDCNFWRSQDVVINALDTWAARLYVDSKCVEFRKPLLESGTLGATGHVQVIVPGLTLNFGATKVQKEVAVPSCTIHHFPHTIHHTLTWAREQFDTQFVSTAEDLSRQFSDHAYLASIMERMPPAGQVEMLRRLVRAFQFGQNASLHACVLEGRALFELWYVFEIKQLLASHPAGCLDEEGLPFWSPPKRAPNPLDFDFSNSDHVGFVLAATRLFAFRHGINPQTIDQHMLRTELAKVTAEELSASVASLSSSVASAAQGLDDAQEAARLGKFLGVGVQLNDNNSRIPLFNAAKFEKDDDSNSHVDFLHYASLLRALNYGITPIDRLESKKIAGKIIPAMVTTTAAITGLVLLQLYHFANKQASKTLETFREANLDLSTNLLAFAEPQACPKRESTKQFRAVPEGFTLWDSLDIAIGDATIKDLGAWLTSKFDVSLKSVTCEGMSLFRASDKATREVRAKMKLTEIYTMLKGQGSTIPPHKYRLVLSLLCLDKQSQLEVEFPTVSFLFRDTVAEPVKKKAKKKSEKK